MAASPQPATIRARNMERLEKNMLWTDTGSPIFKISPQAFFSLGANSRICGNRTVSRRAASQNIPVTIPWASTVARAAPATPIRGKGPTPKIISGSSTIFPTRPTAVDRRITTPPPVAVNRPVRI